MITARARRVKEGAKLLIQADFRGQKCSTKGGASLRQWRSFTFYAAPFCRYFRGLAADSRCATSQLNQNVAGFTLERISDSIQNVKTDRTGFPMPYLPQDS